ncbi:hypothetical protein MLD38_025848 [Melastoma candidum]|uniref:Uncharacterized protein n=1 Tax=Melastoma candidum TaxID=119954 RepID=A0ACB9NX49_9MYRT|nr:hypothetical protein MLD38_025848 [Melastoma candidum]
MAKPATLAALLAGLMLVSLAAASAVTKVEVDLGEDENSSRRFRGGGCRDQLEMVDELRSCEDFLRQQARQGGRRFGGGRFGSRRLQDCCEELRQVDDHCRCQGLREIVRDQQQMRGFGGEREQLERIAEDLPRMCGVGPGRCDIRRGGYGRWE